MAEWSNAVDSKSIVLITGTGSSNLPLSAIKTKNLPCGVFFCFKRGWWGMRTTGKREFDYKRKRYGGIAVGIADERRERSKAK